jgi:hypothetical protein
VLEAEDQADLLGERRVGVMVQDQVGHGGLSVELARATMAGRSQPIGKTPNTSLDSFSRLAQKAANMASVECWTAWHRSAAGAD